MNSPHYLCDIEINRLKSELATAQNELRDKTLIADSATRIVEDLRSQLQTAMEERDAANKKVIYFDNLLDEREAKHAENLSTANSRLEEAEKAHSEITSKLTKAKGLIDRPEFHKLIDECLSRLSASRSTGRKDNTL